jgi:hypothetical protein
MERPPRPDIEPAGAWSLTDRVAGGFGTAFIFAVLALGLGWSLLVVPSGLDGIRHDRIMQRVASVVCSLPPPSGSRVLTCRGTGVANPFNGNQCGYQVNIRFQTQLPLDSLKAFYGRT